MWARRWVRRWPGADRLPRWTPGQAHAASLESMSACARRDVVRIFAIIALLPDDEFVGLHLHRCPRRLANGAARGAQDRPPADPRKRGREPSTRSSTSGPSRTAPTRSRSYGSSSICRKPDRRGSKVSGTFKAHGELRSARTLASRCDERLGWRTFCACVKGARHLQNRSKYSILGSAGRQTAPANLH